MSTQTITATNKTTRGQAPLRWKTGFEPGVNADIPAVAFGVVCWERQVEPVDTSTARLRHVRAAISMRSILRSRRTSVTASSQLAVHSEACLHEHAHPAHMNWRNVPKKSPAAWSCGRDEKTPSLGTRMVRGKYKM
ncbi:hypothetical protein [Burkholderia cepacia]|uniref:hypothetical protein n=1 Tax=Burkholderia cepacia TaxID=292 RepID=UPI00264AC273|nr:hypothetical protein [Burkholderia cepacia]MDN7909390.1 hypothetical protein [Burkholderia cepacia]